MPAKKNDRSVTPGKKWSCKGFFAGDNYYPVSPPLNKSVFPTVRDACSRNSCGKYGPGLIRVLPMLIPGSLPAPANLASGLAGACRCFYFYDLLRHKQNLAALVTPFGATLMSGVTFVAIVTIALFGTIIATDSNFAGFILAYLPIILVTHL